MNLNPPSIVPFSLNRDLESTASVLLSAARMVATMECLPELPRLQHARALREGIAAMRRALVEPKREGRDVFRWSGRRRGTNAVADLPLSFLDALVESIDVGRIVHGVSKQSKDQEFAKVAAAAGMQLERAANLVDLATAQIDRLEPCLSDVALGTLVEDVMRDCRRAAIYREVTLVALVEGESISADRDLLTRALSVIVHRALESTEGRATVELALASDGNLVVDVSFPGAFSPPASDSPMCGLELAFADVAMTAHGGSLELDQRGGRTHAETILPAFAGDFALRRAA